MICCDIAWAYWLVPTISVRDLSQGIDRATANPSRGCSHMADHATKQTNAHSQGDLEMSDVRLLDEGEEDDFMAFGQSDLTSVLANPDFGRRRCTRIVNLFKVLSWQYAELVRLFPLLCSVSAGLGIESATSYRSGHIPFSTFQLQVWWIMHVVSEPSSSRTSTACSTEPNLPGPAGFAALAMVFLILFLVSALSSTGLKTDTGLGTDTDASNISGAATSSTMPNGV